MEALQRPEGLGDGEWSAVNDAEQRLLRAKASSDGPLVIGSAKELCETIAKIVIVERGEVPPSSVDMSALVTIAHKALRFQPGDGLADDDGTRQVAGGLKSVVVGLAEMRNRYGTGHGRAAVADVEPEHAEIAFTAALLWSAWALRRLEPFIAGDSTALVRDLEGIIFHRGELARRLRFARLSR
jgi:hypothetical protein